MRASKARPGATQRPRNEPSDRPSARQAQRTAPGASARASEREPRRERMSKVDTAWLRMDSPINLMLILGVWILQPGIAYEALCERVEQRLLKYPRFRQRVEQDATGATWIDHPVDLREQVVREPLPRHEKGQAQAALERRLGELAALPLDRSRPLWQMHLVEDFEGGSALILRIHHCIADGIALVAVTLSLVDGGPVPSKFTHLPEPGGLADSLAGSLIKPLSDAAQEALGIVGGMRLADLLGAISDRHKFVAGAADAARMAYQVMSDASSILLMPDDAHTRLKGQPGGTKRVAWCAPMPLQEFRAVGRALNCSINDVMLSCVAGALGAYLKSQGDTVSGREIRAMVPVNLRPPDSATELGNRFGLAPLLLPIGVDNPVQRLYEVRGRMRAMKGSTQPLLAFLLLEAAGLLIKPGQDALLNLFARKTTAVITNVPGPREKLKFLGSTLEQAMFWVPRTGDIGLGVSLLSYGGGVQFGVISDAALCPQPRDLVDAFEREFYRLSLLTLMLPWGEEGA